MSRFVSAYTSRYVKEFNSRIGRTGKLFVKEYGNAIKKEAKKIRSAIAYLFNNPVEKSLCNRAEEYRWNYLKYGLIDTVFKELDKDEREYLTDYIIKLYFPFDVNEVMKYYRSYEDMLMAINSNTGSEHDIHEQYYGKTDIAYREIMTYLKDKGIEDIKSVIMMSEDEKRQLAALLKSRTSATYVQIRKFLHICR